MDLDYRNQDGERTPWHSTEGEWHLFGFEYLKWFVVPRQVRESTMLEF